MSKESNNKEYWKSKLTFKNIEKDKICIEFPQFMGNSFRKILNQDNPEAFIRSCLEFTETFIVHLYICALTIYLKGIETDTINSDVMVNKNILDKETNMSFGSYFQLIPPLLGLASLRENDLADITTWFSKKKNKNRFQEIISIRNKIAHSSINFDEQFINENGTKIVTIITETISNCSIFQKMKIMIPLKKISGNRYVCQLYHGYNDPLEKMVYGPFKESLSLEEVYLVHEESLHIYNMHPLFIYTEPQKNTEKKLFISSVSYDSLKLNNPLGNIGFSSKEYLLEYRKKMELLLPDYKYQKKSYLRGFRLMIVKHRACVEILNWSGDVKEENYATVKKIKYEPEADQHDYYEYGAYYQIFPCPDDFFNLKAWDSMQNDLNIEYREKSDTIRDFSIDLGKCLEFEEEIEVNESHHDPMTLRELFENAIGYYDNEFYQPTTVYEFTMIFPKEVRVINYSLFFLNKKINEKKIIKEFKKDITSDGREYLFYKLHEPPYNEFLRLQYEVDLSNIKFHASIFDKVRASHKIYQLIHKSSFDLWEIKTEDKTNTIILSPKTSE